MPMASRPDFELPAYSPRHLLTLGLFVFGMDSLAYSGMTRRRDWVHVRTERHGARAASQFIGPGVDRITLAGLLVPEIHGGYADLARLVEMADSGDDWPLVDGLGTVLGQFHIVAIDSDLISIMAGGIPRAVDFTIDLDRVD